MTAMDDKRIQFSPPDITQAEIDAVADALRSGWITTGPKTKEFEARLKAFTGAEGVACLASATAALECALRALGIGPDDEVITSAYTYTASCSAILHVGATPILCDTAAGSYEMDYDALDSLITERTKAIIPIDIAGVMCDYEKLVSVLEEHSNLWRPSNDVQDRFDRAIIVSDAAHSLGATYQGQRSGSVADMSTFSFHAVKNVTTAEGGALAWRQDAFDTDDLYRQIMLLSLHGQTKDALAKADATSWEYDIAFPGWKCNMTDVQAALGLVQLERYPSLLTRRHEIARRYAAVLSGTGINLISHVDGNNRSSAHLMLARLPHMGEKERNRVIEFMNEAGIATNVHYKPLPLLTAYKNLGFDIADFPNAFAQYENEITLPLHTLLTDNDVDRIGSTLVEACRTVGAKG